MIHPTAPSARIKEATRSAHDRLERTPYATALAAGAASAQSVIGHLRALWIVHDTLERALDAPPAAGGDLEKFRLPEFRRTAELSRDLDRFVPPVHRDIAPAARAALDLAARIRRRSVAGGLSLAGCIYVLEGSRLGAIELGGRVAAALGVGPTASLAYFTGLGAGTEEHWLRVKALIDESLASEHDRRAAIDAARETFAGFEAIFDALQPFDPAALRFTATSINPAAGDHPVPQDERELGAALAAGHRCLEAYPYLQQRYGERGLRFTLSDSAWLATLADQGDDNAARQVRWLAGVLASRGMPSHLLQVHLEILHDELAPTARAPGRHDPLLTGAAVLADLRRRYVDDQALERADGEFDLAVGEPWATRMRNTGRLVAASVADERSGIVDSSRALLDWLTDPQRFPRHFIDAVSALYQRTQGA